MSVEALPLIVPNSFSSDEKTGKSHRKRERSLSEDSEIVNHWTFLSSTISKYSWMNKVKKCINTSIKNDMSVIAFRHIEDLMEKFADENLTVLEAVGDYFVDPEEEISNFGSLALYIWGGFTDEEVNKDESLSEFRQHIDQCYYLWVEDELPLEDLYCSVTSLVMIRYLEEVIKKMSSMTKSKTITLFYCLYVEKNDPRFFMFGSQYIEDGLFPQDPNSNGYTVDKLRIYLADFIKTNFFQPPLLEDGVLYLLSGASNVIQKSSKTTKLSKNICKKLNIPLPKDDRAEFLNLHRYILYLTFENIQMRLRKKEDKTWTVALVLDSLNQAVISYRRKVDELVK
jgi:hypothetical protein